MPPPIQINHPATKKKLITKLKVSIKKKSHLQPKNKNQKQNLVKLVNHPLHHPDVGPLRQKLIVKNLEKNWDVFFILSVATENIFHVVQYHAYLLSRVFKIRFPQ